MNKYLKRKDGIIIDAIKLMDARGLHGLTTRELAAMQGITEPAIYRQFRSKNEIIRAILEDFGKYDEAINATIMKFEGSPLEALYYFGRLYSEYYENYPEIASIMFSIEYLKTDEFLYSKFKQIMTGRKETIMLILKNLNTFPMDQNNNIAEVINGIFLSQTMFWKMEGCTYSLSERINKNLEYIIAPKEARK